LEFAHIVSHFWDSLYAKTYRSVGPVIVKAILVVVVSWLDVTVALDICELVYVSADCKK